MINRLSTLKILIFIAILFTSKFAFGQISAPYELSKNEKLDVDAFAVFNANKYLDFKERDSLVEIIDDKAYKKIDLNNYFGYKKNWKEVENENFETYKQSEERYQYIFQDDTMTETYNEFGSYGVTREIKTVYNSKGFILKRQETVFVNDDYNETRITENNFDSKNRVIKITNRTERKNKQENTEAIIEAEYSENAVKITSQNGTVLCKFIKDKNSIGFISKLSPRKTIKEFMYAISRKRFDEAKEYCTDKMLKEIDVYSNLKNQIEEIDFIEGTEKFSTGNVTANDIWEIKFSLTEKEKYKVNFVLVNQKNGWKIDEFRIEK